MKTVHLFFLLLCCGAAESFTEKLVDLGQNVTLKCEVSVRHVYWFLVKPSEAPVFILRSFTSDSLVSQYRNTTFSKRFSLQYNSTLFIHNITTNELGVYSCIQAPCDTPPNLSRGIRLYTQNPSAENPEMCENGQQPSLAERSFWPVLIILLIVISALVVAVTVRHRRSPPKTQAQPPAPAPRQDSPDLTYSVVQHSAPPGPIKLSNLNSTYAVIMPRTRGPK